MKKPLYIYTHPTYFLRLKSYGFIDTHNLNFNKTF